MEYHLSLYTNMPDTLRFSLIRNSSKTKGETAAMIIQRTLTWFEKVHPKKSAIDLIGFYTETETRHIKDTAKRDKGGVIWRLLSLVLDVLELYPVELITNAISKIETSNVEVTKVSNLLDELKNNLGLKARNELIPHLDTTTNNMKRICKTSPTSFGWNLARFWISVLTHICDHKISPGNQGLIK